MAYVAFWRSPGSPPIGPTPGSPAVRVHLAKERSFLVNPLGDVQDPLGFRSVPCGESDFAEIFFYAKGTFASELRRDGVREMLLYDADHRLAVHYAEVLPLRVAQ